MRRQLLSFRWVDKDSQLIEEVSGRSGPEQLALSTMTTFRAPERPCLVCYGRPTGTHCPLVGNGVRTGLSDASASRPVYLRWLPTRARQSCSSMRLKLSPVNGRLLGRSSPEDQLTDSFMNGPSALLTSPSARIDRAVRVTLRSLGYRDLWWRAHSLGHSEAWADAPFSSTLAPAAARSIIPKPQVVKRTACCSLTKMKQRHALAL
jgi:hypothetical protein